LTFQNNLSVPYSEARHSDKNYIYLAALLSGRFVINFSTDTKEEFDKVKWSLTIQEKNLPHNSSILHADYEKQQQSTLGDISKRM